MKSIIRYASAYLLSAIMLSGISAQAATAVLNKTAFTVSQTKGHKTGVDENCGIRFTPAHYSFTCLEAIDFTQLEAPLAVSDCGNEIVSTTYEEEVFELSCSNTHFTGYFAPQRWQKVNKVYGDDGVDVTGAPNASLLVEGANSELTEVADHRNGSFSFLVPASGYISFSWQSAGSSIFSNDPVQVLINGIPAQLRKGAKEYYTPFMKAGDEFTFQLTANQQIIIDQFFFQSNVSEVITRKWTATDRKGNAATHTQFIGKENVNISQILFPEHTVIPVSQPKQKNVKPEKSGYPVFDKDGNPETINDQLSLMLAPCNYDIQYQDSMELTENGWVIKRLWSIIDYCNNNSMEVVQNISFELQAEEAGKPAPTAGQSIAASNATPL